MKPFYEDEHVTVYHGDALKVMRHLEHVGQVDHLITDPPYSEHVHTNHKTNASTDSKSGGVRKDLGFSYLKDEQRLEYAAAFRRLTRRWAIVFSDMLGVDGWRQDLAVEIAEGPTVFEWIRFGVWVKTNPTPQITGDRPGSGTEGIAITHATRDGKPMMKKWNGGGHAAVWTHAVERNRVHPTQKPLSLMVRMVEQFTDVGDTILDPFAGSGSTGRAAKDLGRKCIMVERNKRHCETIVKRMRQASLFVPPTPEPVQQGLPL